MIHLQRLALLAVPVVAAMSLGVPASAAQSDMHWRAADENVSAANRSPLYPSYDRCMDQRKIMQRRGYTVSDGCYNDLGWGWYFLYNL
ncbi:hypothetical protein [Streptomyces sp. 2A115]|uniref:hypothetical protein n=1 Tax=Streptomyces sp. 2A115 TaxID=3457439 RepID=UPI003FD66721